MGYESVLGSAEGSSKKTLICLLIFLLCPFLTCVSRPSACTVKVHIPALSEKGTGNVGLEAVRIGSVDTEKGSIAADRRFGISVWPTEAERTAKAVEKIEKILSSGTFLKQEDGLETYCGKTDRNGDCIFRNLPAGAYLIRQTDSTDRLKIESAVTAVYSQSSSTEKNEEGIFSCENADIYPKVSFPEKPLPGTAAQTPAGRSPEAVSAEGPALISHSGTNLRTPSAEGPVEKGDTAGNIPADEKLPEASGDGVSPSAGPVRTGDDAPIGFFLFLTLVTGLLAAACIYRLKKGEKASERKHRLAGIFLFLALCACGQAQINAADYDYAEHADDPYKIIFHNVREPGTSLYIRKTVLDSENGVKADGERDFVFLIKLNGKTASDMEYQLFGDDSREIFNYGSENDPLLSSEEDTSKLKCPFRTDHYGYFSLKAGQTASFTGLRGGESYEVEEICPEDFELVSPAGVPVLSGSVSEEGEELDFVNRYLSEGPEKDSCDLRIRKAVPFPADLKIPVYPEFSMQVKIAGKLWAGKEADVYSTMDNSFIRTEILDENAVLKISPGEWALLKDVPSGSDYEIKELDLMDDSSSLTYSAFHVLGSSVRRGSVDDPAAVTFTNLLASFVVSKKLRDGDIQRYFRFILSDSLGEPMKGAQYLLYDGSGNPVYPEDAGPAGKMAVENNSGNSDNAADAAGSGSGSSADDPDSGGSGSGSSADDSGSGGSGSDSSADDPGSGGSRPGAASVNNAAALRVNPNLYRTDDKGRFYLRSGEKAVFLGLRPGTVFQVREEPSFGYEQLTPESSEGYRDRQVGESAQELVFENRKSRGITILPDAGGKGIWVFLFTSMILLLIILAHFFQKLFSGMSLERAALLIKDASPAYCEDKCRAEEKEENEAGAEAPEKTGGRLPEHSVYWG